MWGSWGLLLLFLSHPITALLWITGFTAPPDKRAHHEFYTQPFCGQISDTLNSFCHRHLRCSALIRCKDRWFFFPPSNYAHGTFSYELRYKTLNVNRLMITISVYRSKCVLLSKQGYWLQKDCFSFAGQAELGSSIRGHFSLSSCRSQYSRASCRGSQPGL